ncbi:TonB-dependent receptor [Gemmatimonas sp.]|uniref:TonB-dependent receptor n=1 Tax=Gemmatimonas sp. TaxID=1962908 RepID=UPI003982E99C
MSTPMVVAALALASSPTLSAAASRAVAASAPTAALQAGVTGTVKDTAGAPLSNVQVVVSGANRSALTDDRGQFSIEGVPPGVYHLDFIRIGYFAAHEVVTVTAAGTPVRVTVTMKVATVRLSSVNVTATPTGTDPLNVTQATVQLSGKELQRALSTSLGQTLSKEPGMSTRFNGPMASTPVIRGLTGERVLVLQDGERAGDLSAGAADHMNAVDPSTAERIEVIRGPASLLYGNNAIGGVVNVISSDIPTSIPGRATGYVLGQGESVTPGGVASAGITVPVGKQLAITVRGGFREFENMRVGGGAAQPNTNGATKQFALGAGTVGGRGSVGVVYRQMGFEYGLPHPAGDAGIRIDGVRRMAALQSTISTGYAPVATLRVDGTSQWYSHNEIEPSGAIGTQFKLNTQTVNVTGRTQIGRMTGAVGVQGLFREYRPAGDEAFVPGSTNNNVAAFVFQELPLGMGASEDHTPRVQIGARYDRFSIATDPGKEAARFGDAQSRTFENMAASLGLSVPVTTDVSFTANMSRGFRAPAVEELFANGYHAAVGTFDVGNAALRPEQSTGFEAGLRAQTPRTFAQFSTYYNLINKYIVPTATGTRDVDGTDVPLVNFRQRDATLYGVEGQLETKLVRRWVGGVMGDYVRAKIRNSDDNLPYIPAGRLGASLRYDNGRISAGGDVRRVFAQEKVSGDNLDVATDAYTLLDLSATWLFTVKGSQVHSVTMRVDNALDEQYRDATSRIKSYAYNPGRNLSVVYKLLF